MFEALATPLKRRAPFDLVTRAALARRRGDWLDRDRPRTMNEFIQHKLAYDRRPILTRMADKVSVRELVAARVGADVLPRLYALVDRGAALLEMPLPQTFVLKPNHGSGLVKLVDDSASVSRIELAELADTWLSVDYSRMGTFEWAYKDIRPLVMVEERLGSPHCDLCDYKFFMFGGRCHLIQVDSGRFTDHRRDLLSPSWEPLAVTLAFPRSPEPPARPAGLDAMITLAEEITAGIDFVRCDLYEVDGGKRIVFGELTNYPGAGTERFSDPRIDEELGSHMTWPPSYAGRSRAS